MGVKPDIIILRCDEPLEESIFKKISMFCNVKPDCVIENITLPILYEAPIMLEKSNFSSIVCRELLGLGGSSAPVPEQRTETYYKKRPCGELVRLAADITEKYIKNGGEI